MGHKKPQSQITPAPAAPPSNGYLPPVTQPPFPNRPPQPPVDEHGNRIVLIDCIWNYMGCANNGYKPESECKEEFNTCSMIAMGMGPPQTTTSTTTRRPINDIDLPELPDFLESTTSRPLRPIQDIDLPQNQEDLEEGIGGNPNHNLAINHPEGHESNEFLSCLLRLYQCQNERSSYCPNVERCKPKNELISGGSDRETSALLGEGTLEQEHSGTSIDCRWAYFACGRTRDERECRNRFRSCSGGKQPDNEICSEVAENPQNYLVPHPDDCTKFYSCQTLGRRGNKWIAHQMECPESTGFDINLRICNFIKAIPRCQAKNDRIYRAYQEINTINARQTRMKENQVIIGEEFGEIGYLTSNSTKKSNASGLKSGFEALIFTILSALILVI